VNKQGPQGQVTSQIIGGEYWNSRNILAKDSLAYLNKGRAQGVEENMILPIYKKRQARDSDSMILKTYDVIGYVKVLKATENFATALIVETTDDIHIGDYTGMDVEKMQEIVESDSSEKGVTMDSAVSENEALPQEDELEFSEGIEAFETELEQDSNQGTEENTESDLEDEFSQELL